MDSSAKRKCETHVATTIALRNGDEERLAEVTCSPLQAE
jgi:hypothetical protein